MEANDRERCLELLRQLSERAIATAKAQKAAGLLSPTLHTINKHTVTKVDYSPERGMTGHAGSHTIVTREGWTNAAMRVSGTLKMEPEWSELETKGIGWGRLFSHIMNQVLPALQGQPLSEAESESRRVALLDTPRKLVNLASRPELHVVGLVIQDEPFSIQFDKWKFTFRRPVPEDFSYEQLIGVSLGIEEVSADAFAKAEGEVERHDDEESEDELMAIARWASAIMRLAIPSGVAITGMVFRSVENPAMPAGNRVTGVEGHKNPPARVGAANVGRFTELCELLCRHFRRELSNEVQTRVDHLALAYHRYSEALAEGGLMERRIAEAVMGIESLFMTDKDVIGYKLSMRLPKLLGLVGENPVATKKLISDAYGIRSKYVHGDSLTPKEMKKMVEPHGGMDAMLAKLIACLRLALILCLCALPEKQKRVTLIDNALIDPSKQDELGAAVEPMKLYLV